QQSKHPFAFLLKEPTVRLASGPLSPVRDNIQAFLFFSKSDKFIPTVCAQTATFIQTPIDRASRASANARTGSGERRSGWPIPIRTPCAFTIRHAEERDNTGSGSHEQRRSGVNSPLPPASVMTSRAEEVVEERA
ncbi:hypothetical protein IRJ41_018531, partial [Triplophysa rosa]